MSSIPAESRAQPMQACWAADRVGRAIQNTANLSAADNHYFLASHAPIRRIVDERTKQEVTDAEYFDLVFRSAHRNVQAIVYGEPGSGKSHLIHWLKLRCDDAIRTSEDLRDVRCVLIERRNGSLKDALAQIVEQLGEQFSPYIQKIHTALRQISSETARKELAGQFRLELGSRRADRDLPSLPADLRHLSECFVAPGFGEWLCRDGGAIEQLVSRLTEASSVEERQTTPAFSISDFLPAPERRHQNPPIVRELIDQFFEDEKLCRQACAAANEVTRDAVLGMTGLTGTDLQNVFFDIRRELAHQGQRLALLIEDVSVYQALDRELVVTFEPQVRQGLCDLRVVFGMTQPGLDAIRAMPANQFQRITYIHSVSRSQTRWGDDPGELAQFVARYLNTIRLSDSKVRELAAMRRDGQDVAISACDACPHGVREHCHEEFGAVEFEPGVQVGLFPFTATSPSQWFGLFSDRQANFSQTPRALLTHFLFPGLEHPAHIPVQFPPASISVPLVGLPFWTAFEEQYCGNWTSEEKKRLRRLAAVWVNANSAHELAQSLKGFRQAFAFPEFTRAVGPPPSQPPRPRPPDTPLAPTPPLSPQFERVLTAIEEWRAGKPLREDTVPRELLFDLIKNSISWQDVRGVPPREIQRLLKKDIIDIEDQRVRARGALVRFPRNDETVDLLRALVRFRYLGNNSWSFEDGERFKRMVASWLRSNRERVAACLVPHVPDPEQPMRTACEYLAFIATTSARKQLPSDRPAELIAALFAPPTNASRRSSAVGEQLLQALREKHQSIRDWVAHELNIPQGDPARAGCVFIDPRPILQAFRSSKERLEVSRLSDAYARDIATARYATLATLTPVDGFWTEEREALRDLRTTVLSLLDDPADAGQALTDYCQELVAIKRIQGQKDVDFTFPHEEFDPLWRERLYTQRVDVWCTELRRSQEVLDDETNAALATYTPEVLEQLKAALVAAEHYLDALEAQLRRRLDALTADGDPDALSQRLITALSEIIALGVDGGNA
jgi:hypothetical protein